MDLYYRVLWIENDSDWAESIEEDIQEFVEDKGFIFEKKLIAQKEEDIRYNMYDLILMDLNLASSPTGDNLIQQIRELGVFTNVIFYSASGIEEIRNKGKEKALEGVYYSGRNEKLFLDKVKAVIETTIKKVEDLSNLRGLVMAEVSELDAMMDSIVVKYFCTPDRLDVFHKKITENREKWLHKNLESTDSSCEKKCTLSLRKLPIESIAGSIDSSQKAHAIHELLKDINADNHLHVDNKNFMNNYNAEIISVRNNLAHCESKEKDGLEILCTRKGDVTFSADSFKAIRINIAKYKELYKRIHAEL